MRIKRSHLIFLLISIAIACCLASQEGSAREPRIIKGIMKQFGGYDNDNDYKEDYTYKKNQDNCREKGTPARGTQLVNGTKCYEFVTREMTFDDARDFCNRYGGTLWLPDVFDGDLKECLFVEFPKVFTTSTWIRVRADRAEVDGAAVNAFTNIRDADSDTVIVKSPYLMNLDFVAGGIDEDGEACVLINWTNYAINTLTNTCNTPNRFVCEYELDSLQSHYSSDPYY